ncbi:MAG: hypothetical protein M3495_16455 [Pseudomonadota bacterium]|nr:hypothetical protein [Pseudomonadota bacterium]
MRTTTPPMTSPLHRVVRPPRGWLRGLPVSLIEDLKSGACFGWKRGALDNGTRSGVAQNTRRIWRLHYPEERLDIDQGAGLDPAPSRGAGR